MRDYYITFTDIHEVYNPDKTSDITLVGIGTIDKDDSKDGPKVAVLTVSFDPETILKMAEDIKHSKSRYHRDKYLDYTNMSLTPIKPVEVTNDKE